VIESVCFLVGSAYFVAGSYPEKHSSNDNHDDDDDDEFMHADVDVDDMLDITIPTQTQSQNINNNAHIVSIIQTYYRVIDSITQISYRVLDSIRQQFSCCQCCFDKKNGNNCRRSKSIFVQSIVQSSNKIACDDSSGIEDDHDGIEGEEDNVDAIRNV